ncbi:hypothetical protein K491DRAFT_691115 [Lophiostoma macrostomum CBS 122681]|uniref:Uncharacterized protein n=1 Tax=Lophiostoma macrostomum CBS 122681 TaxID=1314788 RepID=A0A6A6TBE0_9PLEO|nr:hypothetical protein K491DRAFT_691115 [Lophiostoma macrostomum CBS 122681]
MSVELLWVAACNPSRAWMKCGSQPPHSMSAYILKRTNIEKDKGQKASLTSVIHYNILQTAFHKIRVSLLDVTQLIQLLVGAGEPRLVLGPPPSPSPSLLYLVHSLFVGAHRPSRSPLPLYNCTT